MAVSMKKRLPIGHEDFGEIRTEGYYYIDKTALIRDLLQNGAKVNLFTRPRRFGKTLNISMLKSFFEIGCDPKIFEGLEIAAERELCERHMGQFPVISISLKGVEGSNFEEARSVVCARIGKEALRFQFLQESSRLTDREKALYRQLIAEDIGNQELFPMSDIVLRESLQTLSVLLAKHHNRKVIMLIDEYDVPLAKAYGHGYYGQMALLIRSLFEQALKTNDSLEFAVLTGCLRISKESIFTGLNNISVFSITNVVFDKCFGFTDAEVRKLLVDYSLSIHYRDLKEWYNGYRFGNTEAYCPWDVLCHCQKLCFDPEASPQNYWVNTSGNDIIRRFLEKADAGTAKRELERIISGESVEKKIRQDLTYRELYDSMENLWSVLFATGYLTQRGKPKGDVYQLAIPNMEIRDIFTSQIMELFQEKAQKDGASLEVFCAAVQNGDAAEVERRLQQYLKKTICIRDNAVRKGMKENFYHGILLGLLGYKENWVISLNRESGEGYSDIQAELEEEKTGIVIELKYAGKGSLEAKCQEALGQIEQKRYDEKLRDNGMQTILKYGIACEKDNCKVLLVQENANICPCPKNGLGTL